MEAILICRWRAVPVELPHTAAPGDRPGWTAVCRGSPGDGAIYLDPGATADYLWVAVATHQQPFDAWIPVGDTAGAIAVVFAVVLPCQPGNGASGSIVVGPGRCLLWHSGLYNRAIAAPLEIVFDGGSDACTSGTVYVPDGILCNA